VQKDIGNRELSRIAVRMNKIDEKDEDKQASEQGEGRERGRGRERERALNPNSHHFESRKVFE
jgi:hypothetical protein